MRRFASPLTPTQPVENTERVSDGSLWLSQPPQRGGPCLVLQPQAELNGTRLVTLSANGPKTRRPEEAVGIAEVGAVEDVAQLSLEPQIESFLYRKDFEYVDVLVVGRECADGPVSPGCVSEQGIGGGG